MSSLEQSVTASGVRVFSSLEYVDGFELPQPRTEAARLILWNATLRNTFSEASVVNDVASSKKIDGVKNYKNLRPIAKEALRCLELDGLVVPCDRASSSLSIKNYYPNSPSLSKQLITSPLGLQIAAESARRAICKPDTHSRTRDFAERVLVKSLERMLLHKSADHLPGPGYI